MNNQVSVGGTMVHYLKDNPEIKQREVISIKFRINRRKSLRKYLDSLWLW